MCFLSFADDVTVTDINVFVMKRRRRMKRNVFRKRERRWE